MPPRSFKRIAGVLAVVVALAPSGCDEGDGGDNLGAPCRSDDECTGTLECDFHDGPIGTCQAPHMHTTGSGSSGDEASTSEG